MKANSDDFAEEFGDEINGKLLPLKIHTTINIPYSITLYSILYFP